MAQLLGEVFVGQFGFLIIVLVCLGYDLESGL